MPDSTQPTDPNLRFDADQRLTELEIKASFAEDLLEKLDLVVIRQQSQIDLLIREIAQLRQTGVDSATAHAHGAPRNLRDDLPPHF